MVPICLRRACFVFVAQTSQKVGAGGIGVCVQSRRGQGARSEDETGACSALTVTGASGLPSNDTLEFGEIKRIEA